MYISIFERLKIQVIKHLSKKCWPIELGLCLFYILETIMAYKII